MFKKSKLLLTLSLALLMCIASIPTTLAAADYGIPAKTSQAAITKLLEVPYGTAIPASMSFRFEVTANGLNEDSSAAAKALAAAAVVSDNGIVTITYGGSQSLRSTVNGISTYFLESAGIFDVTKYPYAGIYSYTIKELPDSYHIADALHEAITYSNAEYSVQVYVKDGTNGLEIAFIGVIRMVDDNGVDVPEQEKDKLDPTPGRDPNIACDYSEMTFTNKYIKTNGPTVPEVPDPSNPPANSTLEVSKQVKGLFGSSTMYFDFTLTLNLPDLIRDYIEDYYTAYVIEGGKIVDPTNNAAAALIGSVENSTSKYIKFLPNATTSFKLKDGQKLLFVNTPVGTKYTVGESAVAGYTPNVTVVYNGTTAETTTNTDANIPFGANDKYIGEAANSVGFINDSGSATPTGLDLNDLPFIGLIVLALGALALFIVTKTRKKRNTDQY